MTTNVSWQINSSPLKLTLKERKIYGDLIGKYLQIVDDESSNGTNPRPSSSGTDTDDEASAPGISNASTDENINDTDNTEEESDEETDTTSETSQQTHKEPYVMLESNEEATENESLKQDNAAEND